MNKKEEFTPEPEELEDDMLEEVAGGALVRTDPNQPGVYWIGGDKRVDR